MDVRCGARNVRPSSVTLRQGRDGPAGAGSACLPVAAGSRRHGLRLEDVDVTRGPLDRAVALQLVVQATAPVDVMVGQIGLGDLRRGQGQVMDRPVSLDELVLDGPVDLPRDGAKVPRPDRFQRPASSGDSFCWPPAGKTTLYSLLSPRMRTSTRPRLGAPCPGGYDTWN